MTEIRKRKPQAKSTEKIKSTPTQAPGKVEEDYFNLFDNMTEFFVLLEPVFDSAGRLDDFRIREINKAGAKLLGLSKSKIRGKTFLDIDRDYETQWKENLGKVALTGQPLHFEQYSAYLKKWLEVFAYLPRKGIISILAADITGRKGREEDSARLKKELESKFKEQTEELYHSQSMLKVSENRVRTFEESTEDAFMTLKAVRDDKGEVRDFVYEYVNPVAAQMMRLPSQNIIGRRLTELFPDVIAENAGNQFTVWKQVIESGRPDLREFPYHSNGNEAWSYIRTVKINDGVAVYSIDITRRKQMEKDLKTFARRITRIQEEEKKRIAYELHDDTAQYLAILKLEIDSLLQSGKIQDPQVLDKLQYLEKDAGRALNDVRRYSHELRPAVLERMGLLAAVEQIAEDTNKLQEITVEVNVEGVEPDLPEDIKLGFFRIIQEAVSNARKHAKASKASINLQFSENRIEVTIGDNGTGFDVNEAALRSTKKGSLGLTSMQERAKLIGANLSMQSRPGRGTTVNLAMSL